MRGVQGKQGNAEMSWLRGSQDRFDMKNNRDLVIEVAKLETLGLNQYIALHKVPA